MKIRMAASFEGRSIQSESIVDGPGLRAVIWTQGCAHNCPGCQNPTTHDFNGGEIVDTSKIIDELRNLRYHTGVTFSGGDPFFQSEACSIIAAEAKKMGLNVWCYTGFTYEELCELATKKPSVKSFLNNIDVLVDGRFIMSQRNLNLLFRGSENQRLIDMNKTRLNNYITLVDEDEYLDEPSFNRKEIFI